MAKFPWRSDDVTARVYSNHGFGMRVALVVSGGMRIMATASWHTRARLLLALFFFHGLATAADHSASTDVRATAQTPEQYKALCLKVESDGKKALFGRAGEKFVPIHLNLYLGELIGGSQGQFTLDAQTIQEVQIFYWIHLDQFSDEIRPKVESFLSKSTALGTEEERKKLLERYKDLTVEQCSDKHPINVAPTPGPSSDLPFAPSLTSTQTTPNTFWHAPTFPQGVPPQMPGVQHNPSPGFPPSMPPQYAPTVPQYPPTMPQYPPGMLPPGSSNLQLPSRVAQELDILAGPQSAFEGRLTGAEGNKLAAEWLAREITAIGLKPAFGNTYFQNIEYRNSNNVVGMLEGTNPSECIVVGGHFDHLGKKGGRTYHGADDNASGTIAVLEMARALSQMPQKPKRTIVFAFFSGEEEGLIGSKYYVRNPPPGCSKEQTKYMMNFDMVGHFGKNGFSALGGSGSAGSMIQSAMEKQGIKVRLTSSSGGGSDHASFRAAGIPQVLFHTGSHPYYHQPTDTVDTIDKEGLAKIIQGATEFAFNMANTI